MRRLLACLIASGLCAWSSHALAQYEFEPTELVFGDPGTVVFDSAGPKKLFPLPSQVREFASFEDYQNFLRDELNAVITSTRGYDRIEVRAIENDRAYFYHADFGFRPIENALLTYIGGPQGQVIIAGEVTCVNDAICGDPSLPSRSEVNITPDIVLTVIADYEAYTTFTEWNGNNEIYIETWAEGLSIGDWDALLEAHNRRCDLCSSFPGMAGCVAIDCEWEGGELITELAFTEDRVSLGNPWGPWNGTYRVENRGWWALNAMGAVITHDGFDDSTLHFFAAKADVDAAARYDGAEATKSACDGPGCTY